MIYRPGARLESVHFFCLQFSSNSYLQIKLLTFKRRFHVVYNYFFKFKNEKKKKHTTKQSRSVISVNWSTQSLYFNLGMTSLWRYKQTRPICDFAFWSFSKSKDEGVSHTYERVGYFYHRSVWVQASTWGFHSTKSRRNKVTHVATLFWILRYLLERLYFWQSVRSDPSVSVAWRRGQRHFFQLLSRTLRTFPAV